MTETNQTSLTDELYSKDIEIAEFHTKMSEIERRIHFVRTTISAAKLQFKDINRLYYALEDEKKLLTSMLDWTSDLLFYIGGESEDVKDKSQEAYKHLRDSDTEVFREEKVYLGDISKEVLQIRQDLLRLSGEYYERVNEVKPCLQIFEILVEVAREAVHKTKAIDKFSHV